MIFVQYTKYVIYIIVNVFFHFKCIFYRALGMHYIYCAKASKTNAMFSDPGVKEWNHLLLGKKFTITQNQKDKKSVIE